MLDCCEAGRATWKFWNLTLVPSAKHISSGNSSRSLLLCPESAWSACSVTMLIGGRASTTADGFLRIGA